MNTLLTPEFRMLTPAEIIKKINETGCIPTELVSKQDDRNIVIHQWGQDGITYVVDKGKA